MAIFTVILIWLTNGLNKMKNNSCDCELCECAIDDKNEQILTQDDQYIVCEACNYEYDAKLDYLTCEDFYDE